MDACVKTNQMLLLKLGISPGPIDGVMGDLTEAAIAKGLALPDRTPEHAQSHGGKGFVLNERSVGNTRGVHPDLINVFFEAAKSSPHEFIITEGLRTVERQKELVAKGFSKTMNSRHIKAKNGLGHAMDLALIKNGKVDWKDLAAYDELGLHIKRVAKQLGVPIKWGGDWSWKDRPHYQLRWRNYPGT